MTKKSTTTRNTRSNAKKAPQADNSAIPRPAANTIEEFQQLQQAREGQKRKERFSRNNVMCAIIRAEYATYLNDDAANQEATVIAQGAAKSSNDVLSLKAEKEIANEIRNFFNDMKADERRHRLTPEGRQNQAKEKRQATRLDREEFSNGQFGSQEEQEKMLNRRYFLDDEDGEYDDERGDFLDFKALILTWRSDKLNEFCQTLDDIHGTEMRKKSTRRMYRKREETVFWHLSELEEVAALPLWCVQPRHELEEEVM
ncbi:hypothetical protein V8B55DRAFT_1417424 [Mucor lusitanicus]|uniref:Uncharacterized protein n=2 Tax=Mucor circinelloides f. lusitanicus TaxID=29924 RepID=A0A168P0B4_MUCCL|nr:hypothetical protein FB192DRAFT_1346384 [Mucor lusitanicus]OAD06978.1 hypothetical protein MUCCIDRAFT_160588 [Mucor lusitanicus CBS 277.49]